MVRAQLALNRKDPATAINLLQRAKPYELAIEDNLVSAFVRGNAYLAAHRAAEAAAEFQRVLDHRPVVLLAPWGALRISASRALTRYKATLEKPKLPTMI